MKVIPKDVAKTKFDIYICICQGSIKTVCSCSTLQLMCGKYKYKNIVKKKYSKPKQEHSIE